MPRNPAHWAKPFHPTNLFQKYSSYFPCFYVSDAKVEELNPVSCEDVENNYLEREREHVNNKLVKHLLAQLSPRQREALILYYIEERKYEDICQIMNMNYQSVRNLMHRGLSKLKTIAG